MAKKILSATVGETIRFCPGINILQGENAKALALTLAGIFGGIPPQNGKAELLWDTARITISVADGTCTVDAAEGKNIPQIVKDFHKQRFLHFKNQRHIVKKIPEEIQIDDRPLFVMDFDGEDMHTVFAPLVAAGRQVFVVVNKEVSL